MKKEVNKEFPSKKEQEEMLGEMGLSRYFKKIDKILRKWMDMDEENYSLVSLWIVGTYLHKQFSSYPYLFFNAMKGSGKTRMLNIIANLSKNGRLVGSLTEAVLFRTASERTLCIDEAENINAKGKESLSLLINSAYKKGLGVPRMTKKKTAEGEQQVEETFNVYCPLALANIRGMENILADRCISLILEKSDKKRITKLIENFEHDIEFQEIRGGLTRLTEKISDDLNYFGDIIDEWNALQEQDVLDEKDVKDVKTLREQKSKFKELFMKINRTASEGRDLELFFPLFIIADMCGKKILDDLIKLTKSVTEERKHQDREENMDVKLYDFVSQYPSREFVFVSELVNEFRSFVDMSDEWINSRYLGKGLRRLNLVVAERRTNKRSVVLDIDKAQEKMKMFESTISQEV